MSIESIIENKVNAYPNVAGGTITTAVGNPAVTGVGFTAFANNDIAAWVDDAGVRRYAQVDFVTDDNNMTFYTDCLSVTTGLQVQILTAALQTQYWFQADNSVNKVGIVGIPPANGILYSPGGLESVFSADEGILIKSIYLRLPYQYTLADGQVYLKFSYYTAAGVFISYIQTIGEPVNGLYVPLENNEINVNAYVRTPGVRWRLCAEIELTLNDVTTNMGASNEFATVSQINGPDSLNGVILPVTIGARILHASEAIALI